MKLAIEILDASAFDAWDAAVSESPAGSPYSTSAYLNALARVTNRRYELLSVCDGPRIVGGIGLFVHGDGSKTTVSGRYLLYYNGPFVCALPGASWSAQEANDRRVLAAIEGHLRQAGYASVRIKGRHPIADVREFLAHGWRSWPVYSYEVEISDLDACLGRMHRNVRRQLRQAETAGLKVVRSDDVDAFYSMHEETASLKGFSTYLGREAMRSWYEELSGAGLARLYFAAPDRGQPLAGILVLAGGHEVSHTVAAGSVAGEIPRGANAYLRWQAFQDLSAEGFTANDLTDAHEPAVAKFKSQLGARLVMSHELQLPPTAFDHLHGAWRLARSSARRSVKRLVGRGGSR